MPITVLRHVPMLGQRGKFWLVRTSARTSDEVRKEILAKPNALQGFSPEEVEIENIVDMICTEDNISSLTKSLGRTRNLFDVIFLVRVMPQTLFEEELPDGTLRKINRSTASLLSKQDKADRVRITLTGADVEVMRVEYEDLHEAIETTLDDDSSDEDIAIVAVVSEIDEQGGEETAAALANLYDEELNRLITQDDIDLLEAIRRLDIDPSTRFKRLPPGSKPLPASSTLLRLENNAPLPNDVD